MASRDDILKAVRKNSLPPVELPDLAHGWIRFADRRRHFASLVEAVGGRCVFVPDVAELNADLAQMPAYAEAQRIVSLVPDVGRPNVDLDAIDDPHALENVDYAILPGTLGVAENGAVWVGDAGLKHRAIAFIAQHLALVLSADRIVETMHDAYDRLSFPGAGFGVFVSGPSKTADIEQSLVIGAHGPRSLTVFCLGDSAQ